MFKEIIDDPLRLRCGFEPLSKGLREYVRDKQYSPARKGEEFGEMVMDVFSQRRLASCVFHSRYSMSS
jgi:hypothetical protein